MFYSNVGLLQNIEKKKHKERFPHSSNTYKIKYDYVSATTNFLLIKKNRCVLKTMRQK